jgi:hypothetical protein
MWLPYRAQPAAPLSYALYVFHDRAILQLAPARCPVDFPVTPGTGTADIKGGDHVVPAPGSFAQVASYYSFWLRKSRYRTVSSAVSAAAM